MKQVKNHEDFETSKYGSNILLLLLLLLLL
jgi:hypothetical protein